MDYQKICEEVCSLARSIGSFLKSEISKVKNDDIESKGLHDYVTYVDKASEKKIIERLSEILPEAGYFVEEKTITKHSDDYNWIVDPLDGTTNYIHGVPCYSVSIALMKKDKVVVGVVYEVNLDECFYAWQGNPAYINSKEIHVSSIPKVTDALLATGFPYYDYSALGKYMILFTYFLQNSSGIRRLGSAAVDLAYVACGRFEGFFEYGLNPWDVAAGAFIVQQAGGKVYDFKGGKDYIYGKEIVASNSHIADELISIIKSAYAE
ncbi:MAG: inositol monophosphatase family protein [Bacteroidales bacterium]|jgi:myo-inositol-1(or 4)-monophosphatase